jgi:hypothetical protein
MQPAAGPSPPALEPRRHGEARRGPPTPAVMTTLSPTTEPEQPAPKPAKLIDSAPMAVKGRPCLNAWICVQSWLLIAGVLASAAGSCAAASAAAGAAAGAGMPLLSLPASASGSGATTPVVLTRGGSAVGATEGRRSDAPAPPRAARPVARDGALE